MNPEVVASVLCGLAIAAGLLGIVFPLLPGSLLIGVSFLAWALVVNSVTGWIVFGIGALAVMCGMTASAVLTGRRLKRRQVPNLSIVVGVIVGIIGLFVVPVFGLFLGFAAGLFVAELVRLRHPGNAASSSWDALKAAGLGMLVEFCCGALAASAFVVGIWVNFSG